MNKRQIIIATLGGISALSIIAINAICNCYPDLKNILIGIFSSALLLLLTEVIYFLKDKELYGNLNGTYTRKEIYEKTETRQPNDSVYKSIEGYENISLDLKLTYKGNRKYVGV